MATRKIGNKQMRGQLRKQQKEESAKRGTSGKFKVYCAIFFIVCFVVPFCLANFVDGGDEFLTSIIPFVAGMGISLFINWFRSSKHITELEAEDADDYVKKDNVEITYRYDKYTHTTN